MRATTPMTAISLLSLALLTPTHAASAAAETCRGETATIVGTGPTLTGTEDRDVIVTGPATQISALGGNDLICVTTPAATLASAIDPIAVDAGSGADVVDSTAVGADDDSTFELRAVLGAGTDTFAGGPAGEVVVAGTMSADQTEVASESELDVIDTGDGLDAVTSGGPGVANDDEIRLGGGDDVVSWSGVMGARSVLDAGTGSDQLVARASGQQFGVNLAVQTLGRDGAVEARFSSIERLRVVSEPGLGALDVVGSAGPDQVELTGGVEIKAALGGGDDELEVTGPVSAGSVDLGAGTDLVTLRADSDIVKLNLAKRSLTLADGPTVPVVGVEDAYVIAKKVRLIGDRQPNSLRWSTCAGTVSGGGGNDEIRFDFDPVTDAGPCRKDSTVVLLGGKGADRIHGSTASDRIYGGPGNDRLIGRGGRDRAIGDKGRDTCRAEVKRSCER